MRMNELILDKIKERLDEGTRKYGEEILASDKRKFTAESLEEALDMAVYLSAALVRLEYKHERNLTEVEIKDSVMEAISSITRDNPQINLVSSIAQKNISIAVLECMKNKMRSKYNVHQTTQRLETQAKHRNKSRSVRKTPKATSLGSKKSTL
jgi:3-methyladenine DNA glycosylase/8-oxoguanine DNA glycosylase